MKNSPQSDAHGIAYTIDDFGEDFPAKTPTGRISSHFKNIYVHGTLKDKDMHLTLTKLDEGITALIVGGDRTHIGSVTVISPEGEMTSADFPGHKEACVTQKAAGYLYRQFKTPVTVTAGIHFDNITKEEITAVLEMSERMLMTATEELRKIDAETEKESD